MRPSSPLILDRPRTLAPSVPTGDFLAHVGDWTGLPAAELLVCDPNMLTKLNAIRFDARRWL
jgi:hypothetical protein